MLRTNPHANDKHWWVYIDHPILLVIILASVLIITILAIKHLRRLSIGANILLYLCYWLGYLVIRLTDNQISSFVLFAFIVVGSITYMKIKNLKT